MDKIIKNFNKLTLTYKNKIVEEQFEKYVNTKNFTIGNLKKLLKEEFSIVVSYREIRKILVPCVVVKSSNMTSDVIKKINTTYHKRDELNLKTLIELRKYLEYKYSIKIKSILIRKILELWM